MKYIKTVITKELFTSLTIKSISSGEIIEIYPVNSTNGYIQWNHIDDSKVFTTSRNNWFSREVGTKITFYRQSQPEYSDDWEIINIKSIKQSKLEETYIIN